MQFLKFGLLALIFFRLTFTLRRVGSGSFEELTWKEQKVGVQLKRAKGKVVHLTLRLPIQDKLKFALRGETRFDRFAKGLGISQEWQTGDSGFDEKVFILSEDVVFNHALMRDRELRDACSRLLGSLPGANIECRAGMLYVAFASSDVEDAGAAVVRFARELE